MRKSDTCANCGLARGFHGKVLAEPGLPQCDGFVALGEGDEEPVYVGPNFELLANETLSASCVAWLDKRTIKGTPEWRLALGAMKTAATYLLDADAKERAF